MHRKRYSPSEIVDALCEAEAALSRGEKTGHICRRLGISEQSYYHWRDWSTQLDTDMPGEQSVEIGNEGAANVQAEGPRLRPNVPNRSAKMK